MVQIPDSIDSLNLSGIMPFDVKTFIKDGKVESLAPKKDAIQVLNGLNKQDEFFPSAENKKENKKNKFNFKMGLLGASLVFLAFTILSKKCPKIGEFTSGVCSGIKKVFKK